MELDKEKIHYFQKNRGQFLMIDHVTELEVGSHAKGYKILNKDLWFFKVHWPGDPNMPASLQLESLTQICALPILAIPENLGKFMYVVSANNLKFKKKITPDFEKFDLDTKITSYKRGIATCLGKGFINGELACTAEFTLVLAGELEKFKIKK